MSECFYCGGTIIKTPLKSTYEAKKNPRVAFTCDTCNYGALMKI